MELQPKERLMLALLYRILEHVSDDEENYAEKYEALEGGYAFNYPDGDGGWLDVSEEHSKEECEEVWDILRMFDNFSIVLDRLNDKGGLELHVFKFKGFDGNHDWQYSYQCYIVKTLERFGEIVPEPLNSHGTVLPLYRRMLGDWRKLMERYGFDLDMVTKEDLFSLQQQVLNR